MIIGPKLSVSLAFIVFIIANYLLPESLSRLNIFNQAAHNYPIFYPQLIIGLFSFFSIWVLSDKIDFGLKFISFNWRKILLVTFCIEAIPLTIFLLGFFFDALYLSSWMLLSLVEIAMYHLILSPLVEEVFFRGLIQTLLSPLLSIKLRHRKLIISAPVVISSILFAVVHFQYSFTAIVFIVFLGVFCGHLREKYNSIVPGIFAHFVFNLLAVFIPKLILIIGKTFSFP